MIDLTIKDISTISNAILKQATGITTPIEVVDTQTFISVATPILKCDTDVVLKAISQVLSNTIFSMRGYDEKFKGLQRDVREYGNHVRKLQTAAGEYVEDGRYSENPWNTDNMFIAEPPEILQTNFYGECAREVRKKFFKDQLNIAFSSPDEFSRFISMVMTETNNDLKQGREATARMVLNNRSAGAILSGNTENSYIPLLTMYNNATGQSLTATTVYHPDNYPAFIKWAYAKIASIASLMTERSALFHKRFTKDGEPINILRHTPYNLQNVFILASTKYNIEARVLADTFHDKYLKLSNVETVNYWQNITDPEHINISPALLDDTGAEVAATTAQKNAIKAIPIFAVIMDYEAAGVTQVNQWSATSPLEAHRGFTNQFWHETDRYWNDLSENCVVFGLT